MKLNFIMSLKNHFTFICLPWHKKKEASMEILKVENLRKEYGEGNSKVIALDGVNLEIERG